MSLTPPPKVQKLQAALHAKAKGSPGYRFYLLYDKVYRRDVLAFAYQCCSANGGAAGVDGQTFADIEKYGVETMAGRTDGRTQEEDVSSAAGAAGVHPQAGRQADGRWAFRRSGTAWCRWRRCWFSEPIFEADLQPEQYAYRPDRSALDAVRAGPCAG